MDLKFSVEQFIEVALTCNVSLSQNKHLVFQVAC